MRWKEGVPDALAGVRTGSRHLGTLASFFPQVNEELLKYCSGKRSTTVDLADLYQEDRRRAAELRQVHVDDWIILED